MPVAALPTPAVLHLLPDEVATLVSLSSDAFGGDDDAFCWAAATASRRLGDRVHDAFAAFAARGSTTGALLVRGLPASVEVSTPLSWSSNAGSATPLARASVVLCHTLGHMVGYEAEGGGKLFQGACM